MSDARGGDFPWLTATPDGVLHAATWTRVFLAPATGQPNPVRDLFHVSSSDRGRTYGERHAIDPGNQQHGHPPVIASDPESGDLYATWVAQPAAEDQAAGYRSDLEVYFRCSADGGRTWTAKKTLNDDGLGKANQFDPSISVAPNPLTIRHLRVAALLHDVGRAGISNAVWEKAGALTTAQWEQARMHAYHSER
ncbi:MAG: hypothetical protein ACRD2W_13820, partial [Acidimicrobiales bacterium]